LATTCWIGSEPSGGGNGIGSSAAVGFSVAVGGTISYVFSGINIPALPAHSLGFIYLPALSWIALASVITAPLGAKATHHMKVSRLRKLFALLLLVLATKMLLKVIA